MAHTDIVLILGSTRTGGASYGKVRQIFMPVYMND